MSTTKRWTVEILLNEEDVGTTHAVARLDTSEDAHLQGRGTWRSQGNTDDSNIGDDIAVANALSQIAVQPRGLGAGSGGHAHERQYEMTLHLNSP